MTTWDPERYLRFTGERLRPSLDLIARLEGDPHTIWDLGCGTGEITALLAALWPSAEVHGLDSSDEMLKRARTIPGIHWVAGGIAAWTPERPADLIVAMASLQWVGGHERLFPHLLGCLAPGGTLAVQMPRNFSEPSHTALAALAQSERWQVRVGHLVREVPVADPRWYHALLRPLATRLEMWETIYHHVLAGTDPVAEWVGGTTALPFLTALGKDDEAFLAEYAEAVRTAYPTNEDGTTLFPFRRLFMVAGV